jgi:hypothetical protein
MIFVIKAAKAEVANQLANALRDSQIAAGKGALLVNPDIKEHPVQHQIEKIIDGALFSPDAKLKEVPWKKDALVIVYDEKDLKAFDEAAPGFTKLHGPVQTITVK